MKKLRFLLILATLVALPILAIRYVLEERTHAEQKVREAAYRTALLYPSIQTWSFSQTSGRVSTRERNRLPPDVLRWAEEYGNL